MASAVIEGIRQSTVHPAPSAPAKRRGDVSQDRLNDMRIVRDAKLIRDCQEQRVSLRDGLIRLELLDQGFRLGGIAAAEDRASLLVDKSHLVLLLASAAEVSA